MAESLKKRIEALAAKEGYSVSQFLASAAREKLAVVLTLDYLRREAAAGRRADFEKYLAAVRGCRAARSLACRLDGALPFLSPFAYSRSKSKTANGRVLERLLDR